jgi:bis(5'-nucleosyl)-tetraphosphatase (symmetrical)
MATWAIGDVQGCATTLERLLSRISFHAGRDRLLFTGDLVNRGARSLDALRLVRALGVSAVSVLGNHELHLLARAHGVARAKELDTLDDVLEAPDRDELLAWMAALPLLFRGKEFLLVHAGLHPRWDVAEAEALARGAEEELRSDTRAFLSRLAASARDRLGAGASGEMRRLFAARVLTRIRTVREDGSLCSHGGPPADAPAGCAPWFAAPGRRSGGATVVFGHWSALGLHLAPGLIGLDTGCVWGRLLTAVRLDDLSVEHEPQAVEDRV